MDSSLATAREVYPSVAGVAFARGWAGLEAFTPDEVPVLGPVPGIDGLFVAAGFSGHGFALSPMIGDVLARLALGRDARPELWRRLRFDRPGAAHPASPPVVARPSARLADHALDEPVHLAEVGERETSRPPSRARRRGCP